MLGILRNDREGFKRLELKNVYVFLILLRLSSWMHFLSSFQGRLQLASILVSSQSTMLLSETPSLSRKIE